MKKIRYILILFSLLIFWSCNNSKKELSVGTFNIKWLGDKINDNIPRNENDYKRIADIIEETNSDILCLQEIENTKSLENLLNYLPDYKIHSTNYADYHNLGIIYKSELKIDNFKTYKPIQVNEDTRPGLTFRLHIAGKFLYFLNLHLKSTSRYDSTKFLKQLSYEYREKQSKIIQKWADSLKSKNKAFIILGDLNDNPHRKNSSINNLYNNKNLIFLTDGFKSCTNPIWMAIDHIIISKNLYDNYVKSSSRIFNFYNILPDKYAENISDHCPVIANFNFN